MKISTKYQPIICLFPVLLLCTILGGCKNTEVLFYEEDVSYGCSYGYVLTLKTTGQYFIVDYFMHPGMENGLCGTYELYDDRLILHDSRGFSLYFDLNKADDTLLFQKEKHDKEEKNYVFMEEGTIWTRFDTLPDTLNPAHTSSRRKLENLTLGLDSQRGADE